MKNIPDVILNLLVFLSTAGLIVWLWLLVHKTMPEKFRQAFRFFTTLSNILCAAACLLTAVFAASGEIPAWVWLFKFIGTAAVTLTMLTVFLFMAPSIGKGWAKELLTGQPSDFFMHLVNPVLALVSFCVFEKRGMTFWQALPGVIPIILYGILYAYKVQHAPEGKRWDDFYGFARGGKIAVTLAGLALGGFLVSMGLMLLQNI